MLYILGIIKGDFGAFTIGYMVGMVDAVLFLGVGYLIWRSLA